MAEESSKLVKVRCEYGLEKVNGRPNPLWKGCPVMVIASSHTKKASTASSKRITYWYAI